MCIRCAIENGATICYVSKLSRYEDCETLARYFKKHWNADVEKIYDIGSDVKYTLMFQGTTVDLIYHSSLGNFIRSEQVNVSDFLSRAITDLNERLSE
ncbi:hypothetical protein BFP70_12035 [Thioclava sp. SK-1]|nr:hypothetical protein BFP70_12035 [Thioclava sp. SK-1]